MRRLWPGLPLILVLESLTLFGVAARTAVLLLAAFASGATPACGSAQAAYPQIPEHVLDGIHRQRDPVHASPPASCPGGAPAGLLAGMPDELGSRGRHPPGVGAEDRSAPDPRYLHAAGGPTMVESCGH